MPPRMRGRGRGAYAAPNDHEAGPSHRRTPSDPHRNDAQDLWRSFTEPARRSVSLSTSPSIPHSFGPHSENEPHHPQQSYIPLGPSSPFDNTSPVYQGLYDPDDYLQEPVGFNPLGPEDHFSGGNPMDVDEDTDPAMPPSGTPNHPIEISDGSPFMGSPYNGPDSYEEMFKQYDWVFTPSYHNSPLHQSHHHSPLHQPHHSPLHQPQQQPQQQQQNPSEDSRFVAVTPPAAAPPTHPPSPPRRRRTTVRMSARGGVRISTPPLSSGSRYSPVHEETEMTESSNPVSEVTTAPVAPQPPLGSGNPIPTYTGAAAFNPFEPQVQTGYNFTGDPYWLGSSFNVPQPGGSFGDPWATGPSTYGYPPYGYQQSQPLQPPQYQQPQPPQPPFYQPPQPSYYQQPPQAPMMSPPQVQGIIQEIQGVRQEFREELQNDRRHNRGMFQKVVRLLKGKRKKDH